MTIDALARHESGRRRLFCCAFGAAGADGRRKTFDLDRDLEGWRMVRSAARHQQITRRRKTTRLRPFLQSGFGVAQIGSICETASPSTRSPRNSSRS